MLPQWSISIHKVGGACIRYQFGRSVYNECEAKLSDIRGSGIVHEWTQN